MIAMISERMQKALNEQIKNELESAYIYLSMVAHLHSAGLNGMAQWMRAQTREEMVHAMKFFDHIADRGGRVTLLDLKQLKTEWSSPLEVFQDAYKHEQFITSKINGLVDLAREENDAAAGELLQWFVKEQQEEEESASGNVSMLEQAGDSPEQLAAVDQELGKRTFSG